MFPTKRLPGNSKSYAYPPFLIMTAKNEKRLSPLELRDHALLSLQDLWGFLLIIVSMPTLTQRKKVPDEIQDRIHAFRVEERAENIRRQTRFPMKTWPHHVCVFCSLLAPLITAAAVVRLKQSARKIGLETSPMFVLNHTSVSKSCPTPRLS